MEEERQTYGSYEEMYQKEYHTVYAYIRRMISGNDAVVEDLTQEVFFVAYQKWDKILVHPNPPGFLIVVAQNKIKKWFREKKPLYVDDAQLLELLSENGKGEENRMTFSWWICIPRWKKRSQMRSWTFSAIIMNMDIVRPRWRADSELRKTVLR